jgi:hypothetical protein
LKRHSVRVEPCSIEFDQQTILWIGEVHSCNEGSS